MVFKRLKVTVTRTYSSTKRHVGGFPTTQWSATAEHRHVSLCISRLNTNNIEFYCFKCVKCKLSTQLVPSGHSERSLTCLAEWSSEEEGLFEEEKKTLRPDAPSIAEETPPLWNCDATLNTVSPWRPWCKTKTNEQRLQSDHTQEFGERFSSWLFMASLLVNVSST